MTEKSGGRREAQPDVVETAICHMCEEEDVDKEEEEGEGELEEKKKKR